MDPIGPAIQASLAGAGQAERQTVAKKAIKDRDEKRFRRALDEAEFGDGINPTDMIDALRDVEGNDQEESHEDRQQHNLTHAEQDAQQQRLDLEG